MSFVLSVFPLSCTAALWVIVVLAVTSATNQHTSVFLNTNQCKGRPPSIPQHDHNHTDHQNSTAVAVAAAHAQNGPLVTLERHQTTI